LDADLKVRTIRTAFFSAAYETGSVCQCQGRIDVE